MFICVCSKPCCVISSCIKSDYILEVFLQAHLALDRTRRSVHLVRPNQLQAFISFASASADDDGAGDVGGASNGRRV